MQEVSQQKAKKCFLEIRLFEYLCFPCKAEQCPLVNLWVVWHMSFDVYDLSRV